MPDNGGKPGREDHGESNFGGDLLSMGGDLYTIYIIYHKNSNIIGIFLQQLIT